MAKQSVRSSHPSINNSSCDADNESITDDRIVATDDVESVQRSQQKNTVICVEQQSNQSLSPVRTDYPTNHLHLDEIQQRSARAFSAIILKKQITKADNVMPTEGRTISALPHEAWPAIDENSQSLSDKIRTSSVSQQKRSLSVSEGNTFHLDQGVNEAFYIKGMRFRAPPAIVSPNVPDPAPPPLPLDLRSPCLFICIADGTPKCVGVYEGLIQLTPAKSMILSDFLSELLSDKDVVTCISKCGGRWRRIALDIRLDMRQRFSNRTINNSCPADRSLSQQLLNLHRANLDLQKPRIYMLIKISTSVHQAETTATKIILIEKNSCNNRIKHSTIIVMAVVANRIVRVSELIEQVATGIEMKHFYRLVAILAEI